MNKSDSTPVKLVLKASILNNGDKSALSAAGFTIVRVYAHDEGGKIEGYLAPGVSPQDWLKQDQVEKIVKTVEPVSELSAPEFGAPASWGPSRK